MLAPITIRHDFAPRRRSLATATVADLFGLADREPPHTVCENLELDVRPGDLVLFSGPSGGGKSSLMRAVAAQVGAVDPFARPLPDVPVIDALPGCFETRLARLAACGLSEARLLLRTPAELSEGERYRFRLCLGFVERGTEEVDDHSVPRSAPRAPRFLLADEFTATLDRTLAKVVAYNVRKLVTRTGVGLLAATTHEDIIDDLDPDVIVRCRGDGFVDVERRATGAADRTAPRKKPISFADNLWMSEGTARDWPYFARWHYRAHKLAFVKRVVLLWHGEEPVGVCVFAAPAASLALRSKYFGLKDARSSVALSALNEQLWVLQRVVLHPTYRGAGIASLFVRRACETCPVAWIETLTAMGRMNPLFARAGFAKVGPIPRRGRAGQFGPRAGIAAESAAKSRYSEPMYYVFDNRSRRPRAESVT